MKKEEIVEYVAPIIVGCSIAIGLLWFFITRVRAAILFSIVDKEGKEVRKIREDKTVYGRGSGAPVNRIIFYGCEEDMVALSSVRADEKGEFSFPVRVEGVIEPEMKLAEVESKEVNYLIL